MNNKANNSILAELKADEYQLVVGTGDSDALRHAFLKKRVVHPGISGRPLSPTDCHMAWSKTMQQPLNDKSKKRTAYIHIPFCSKLCLYCGFFQNFSNEERETMYIDSLIKELAMAEKAPYIQDGLIHAVFIGGGTPSALSPANAARLLQAIHKYLPLSNDCELTFEARINDLVEEKLESWFANGVNRISIGVQSFDTKLRQDMGRIDTRETVIERLKKAAAYNQAAIIVDLIYGLPGQTMESFIADLEAIDSLPIEGMDLYQLNLFEISPLKKAIDEGKLPPAATTARQAEMFAAAGKWLEAREYRRLSNSHWSKSPRERNLYNVLTKQGVEVIPFGAGAGGNIGEYTLFCHRDLKAYMGMMEHGVKPLMVMAKKSPLQEIHNAVLREIEMGCFNLNSLADKYGQELLKLNELLDIWQANGLIERGEVLVKMTNAGRFWNTNLSQSLLEMIEAVLNEKVAAEVQQIAEQG